MIISSKGEYGVRALFDLAQQYGTDPVTSADIAARQQIPEAYLEQLLALLRKGGLVRSVRGPQGGYTLAFPPDMISLADAVQVLEGDLAPVQGFDDPPAADERIEQQVLRDVWREMDAAIGQVLESTTLQDLCDRKQARGEQIMYYI